ncbi:MAG: HEPN domain-containing protein [Candidatus Paceibacterota bacterium]
MKQELDQKSIEALSKYRIQRANETLPEAQMLIKNGFFNAAINRLYYACYYSVNALLINQRITAQTHAGVKQMFGLHFIVTGKLPSKLGRFYNQLFNDRITGDYDDFVSFNKEMLDEIYPNAEDFVNQVSAFISHIKN